MNLRLPTCEITIENLSHIFVRIGKVTNDFLNQNSKDIIDEVMPAIEQVTSTLLDDICNKAFRITSWDKLTPK